uniref:Calmodulin like 4 n=1 Tax=Falco tinnunculus TaxID=100819 RepID=A0A8C4V1W1_FALTI
MAKFLSQDQINEFKECFSLYDKKQKGKIKASDLMAVMRCLGASPTPGEVQRHLHLHKIDRNAELDFSTFLNIMYRQMKQEEPEKEILTALSMIDRQKTGVITVSELRAKLTRLGEKLSEEEGILQFKAVSNGPHLLHSSLVFLCSQIWDQVLPAGKPEGPVPAGNWGGA